MNIEAVKFAKKQSDAYRTEMKQLGRYDEETETFAKKFEEFLSQRTCDCCWDTK